MAQRRMFTKEITNSSEFIKMSSSAQALYFHLNMASDDDGFCNEVDTCMFRAKASEDDLKVLIAKRFILEYQNASVIVIKHWRMNNYLRKDRYSETKYRDEKKCLYIKENGAYTTDANEGVPLISIKKEVGEIDMTTDGIPNGNQMATQYRLGKDSIGKNSIVKDSIEIKQDITGYKQNELLQMLVKNDYLTINELQDTCFDDLLTRFVETYGYVDTKIKVQYFIDFLKTNQEEITDKYNYLKTSLQNSFNKFQN